MQYDQECVYPTSFGYKLFLREGDCISQQIIDESCYQGTEILAIQSFLKKLDEPIAFDIGANVGTHGLAMQQYSKQVYMFEPQPQNIELLNKSIQINKAFNCEVVPCGVSKQAGQAKLYINVEGNNGGSTMDPDLYHAEGYQAEAITVNLIKGDDFVQERSLPYVSLIKIDVESLEAEVLEGLEETINSSQPIIFMEWYHDSSRNKFRAKNLFNTLLKGYEVKVVVNDLHEYQKKTKGDSLRVLKRLFYRLMHRRRFLRLAEFKFANDYSLIMLYPKVKKQLVQDVLDEKDLLPS